MKAAIELQVIPEKVSKEHQVGYKGKKDNLLNELYNPFVGRAEHTEQIIYMKRTGSLWDSSCCPFFVFINSVYIQKSCLTTE